jgi:hypothetical protein
MPDVG